MHTSPRRSSVAAATMLLTASFLLGACAGPTPSTAGPAPANQAGPTLESGSAPRATEGPESSASVPAPEPSVTPSPTWRPTPEVPITRRVMEGTRPSELDEKTDEGARAAFDWFWRSEERARMNGDLAPLVDISHPDCTGCTELIDGIAEQLGAGGYILTSYFHGHNPEATLDESTDEHVFKEHLTESRRSVYDAEEKLVDETPQRTHDSTVRVRWIGDRWVVSAFESEVIWTAES